MQLKEKEAHFEAKCSKLKQEINDLGGYDDITSELLKFWKYLMYFFIKYRFKLVLANIRDSEKKIKIWKQTAKKLEAK